MSNDENILQLKNIYNKLGITIKETKPQSTNQTIVKYEKGDIKLQLDSWNLAQLKSLTDNNIYNYIDNRLDNASNDSCNLVVIGFQEYKSTKALFNKNDVRKGYRLITEYNSADEKISAVSSDFNIKVLIFTKLSNLTDNDLKLNYVSLDRKGIGPFKVVSTKGIVKINLTWERINITLGCVHSPILGMNHLDNIKFIEKKLFLKDIDILFGDINSRTCWDIDNNNCLNRDDMKRKNPYFSNKVICSNTQRNNSATNNNEKKEINCKKKVNNIIKLKKEKTQNLDYINYLITENGIISKWEEPGTLNDFTYRYKHNPTENDKFDYIKQKDGKQLFRIPSFSDRIFINKDKDNIKNISYPNDSYKTLTEYNGSDHKPITGQILIRNVAYNNYYKKNTKFQSCAEITDEGDCNAKPNCQFKNNECQDKKVASELIPYFWMRHGESCANAVKNVCHSKDKITKKQCNNFYNSYKGTNTNKNKKSLKRRLLNTISRSKITDGKFKHTLIPNPNLTSKGVKQCERVNIDINKKIYGDENYKNLENTIVFCSTLVRAIETAVLTSGKTNIIFLNLDNTKEDNITLIINNYQNSVFVIPYIKETGDTVDNLATDYEDTVKRLNNFFDKNGKTINIYNYLGNYGNKTENKNAINFFNSNKNIVSISDFRDKVENTLIKGIMAQARTESSVNKFFTLNNNPDKQILKKLPLYIVSHQGFILKKVLNMSKDEKNNIYIKNCNVVSNLHSNESIKPEFAPDDNINLLEGKPKLVLQFDLLRNPNLNCNLENKNIFEGEDVDINKIKNLLTKITDNFKLFIKFKGDPDIIDKCKTKFEKSFNNIEWTDYADVQVPSTDTSLSSTGTSSSTTDVEDDVPVLDDIPLFTIDNDNEIKSLIITMGKENYKQRLVNLESIIDKHIKDSKIDARLNDKLCLITPSTDTISLDKKIYRIKYILELNNNEYNIIQGYKNKIIELEKQIEKGKKEENGVLYTIKELIQTEMDFYYDMVILISCTRYIFDLKGEKINGKIDKPIEISDKKRGFFNEYISYIIKFTKSLINLNFKYENDTKILKINIEELENIHKDKDKLYILINLDKILTQTKINDLLNGYKIIANTINNIDFLNITSNISNEPFYTYQQLCAKPFQRTTKYPLLYREYTKKIKKNNNNINQLIGIIQKINDIQENYFTDTNDNKTIQDVKNIIGDKIFAYYLDDKIGKNIHIEVFFERLNEKLEKFNFLFDFLKKNSQIINKIGAKIDNQEYGNLKNILDKEYKPKIINRLGGRNPLSYLRSVLKGYSGVKNALLDEIKTLPQSAGNNKKRTRKQPSNSKYKTKKNPSIHKGNQSKKRGITKGNHKSKKRS